MSACLPPDVLNSVTENQLAMTTLISQLIAAIDRKLNQLLNKVLHHPILQHLEASWRSLYELCQISQGDRYSMIRILDVQWDEIAQDLDNAIDIEQSDIFYKIYHTEFGMPGGFPYGVMIVDHALFAGKAPQKDCNTLTLLAEIASAAFCPILISMAADFFSIDNYSELSPVISLDIYQRNPVFKKFLAFQQSNSAQFVTLVLPKVRVRKPYAALSIGFPFAEYSAKTSDYLWSNAAFKLAEVILRCFKQTGWFNNIRGLAHQQLDNGLVTDKNPLYFSVDSHHLSPKPMTEVVLTETQRNQLNQLGIAAVCTIKETSQAAFYHLPTAQHINLHNSDVTVEQWLPTMLPYILCVSRFAHFIKIISREKIGRHVSAKDIEFLLNQWLKKYIAGNSILSKTESAKYPLRDAKVEVNAIKTHDRYHCKIYLRPRLQSESLDSHIVLMTKLNQIMGS